MKKIIYLLSAFALVCNPLAASATDYNSAAEVVEAVLDTDYSSIRSGQLKGQVTVNTGDTASSMTQLGQAEAEVIIDFLNKLEGSGNFSFRYNEFDSNSEYSLQSIFKNNMLYYKTSTYPEWESFEINPEAYFDEGVFKYWIDIISEQSGTIFNDTALSNDKLVHFSSNDKEYVIQSKTDLSVEEFSTILLDSIDLVSFKARILDSMSKELATEDSEEERERRMQKYSERIDETFNTYFNKEFLTTVLVEVPRIEVRFQKDDLYPTKFDFELKINVFNFIKQSQTSAIYTDDELKERGTPNFGELIIDISLQDYNQDFEISAP